MINDESVDIKGNVVYFLSLMESLFAFGISNIYHSVVQLYVYVIQPYECWRKFIYAMVKVYSYY